ncbi:MAG: PrsW family intramembrane metalloprotease [Chloroflexi bacterium HGW-Chloroflexi-6]|nr:MAG: PrsW family intramembrane metalloprotease [Chloroflexi bacterium HGW-Chloroflexi-6]
MTALLAALFFGFVPCFLFAYILYWLDRYEKEPILLLGAVFMWGVVVAAGGSYILNSLFGMTIFAFSGSEELASVTGATLSAPLVEETLKGLAVLIVFLIFRHEFDSILDGIVYAGIAALGFAATENSIYIWRGYVGDGWGGLAFLVFIRVILVGWQHPFYTAFIGIGLAVARTNRNGFVKFIAPLTGWGLAMFTHSMHNFLASIPLLGDLTCLLGSLLDWSGVLFMFVVILWANWMEQKNITLHMREEVQSGIISPAQYRTACSAWAQSWAWLTAIFSGRFQATSRFYQVVGELAHKKEQLRRHGDESGNSSLVQKYRQELAALAPRAQS